MKIHLWPDTSGYFQHPRKGPQKVLKTPYGVKVTDSRDLKSEDFLVGFQTVRFSNGHALAMALVQNHLKIGPFKIRFCPDFKKFDKMAAICPDFKWLVFRFSDTIQNPDHLQPNPFLTIQNPYL